MSTLENYRYQKDLFFEQDPHSPLSEEQKKSFQGLAYYPENPDLRLVIVVEPFEEQREIHIQTSTGDTGTYLRYGRLKFEIEGQPAELTVYLGRDGNPFIPFRDLTSGDETYGAGRYLEPETLDDRKFLVDFNLAYNPWCAYSQLYSCPLPPDENRLSVPIRAGEKAFPPK
jgi:uncharacterized protein (DUF1684 family)